MNKQIYFEKATTKEAKKIQDIVRFYFTLFKRVHACKQFNKKVELNQNLKNYARANDITTEGDKIFYQQNEVAKKILQPTEPGEPIRYNLHISIK